MSEYCDRREFDTIAPGTTSREGVASRAGEAPGAGDADGEARLDRARRTLFEHLRALGPACL